MTAPRLEIDLSKIQHNARALVERLARHGISVTGVTKASLGSPELAGALLRSGVKALGESRIENIEALRHAQIPGPMILLRSPMLSQVPRVVASADISFNTEIEVIERLSFEAQAQGRRHGVVLMVELGDLREGILPVDLEETVRVTVSQPNLRLVGIGTNLACHSGASPDARNMSELSTLAHSLESTFDLTLDIVSGGNSANLDWALSGAAPGRINNLRLGESILLGRETLHRRPIAGLHTDAMTIVAETIECKTKPSQPWGEIAQPAFGEAASTPSNRGEISQAILALGRQEIDPLGLYPPPGIEILGASSDHLVVDSGPHPLRIGSEVTFQVNYSALLRAMSSTSVAKVFLRQDHRPLVPLRSLPLDQERDALRVDM
jgi:predicted amino acid racemase